MALGRKNPPANARDVRDTSSIPKSGRSPGAGHSNPLQSSCRKNPMDRGAWQATVHRVAESRTRLSAWAHPQYTFGISQSRSCLYSLHALPRPIGLGPAFLAHYSWKNESTICKVINRAEHLGRFHKCSRSSPMSRWGEFAGFCLRRCWRSSKKPQPCRPLLMAWMGQGRRGT